MFNRDCNTFEVFALSYYWIMYVMNLFFGASMNHDQCVEPKWLQAKISYVDMGWR